MNNVHLKSSVLILDINGGTRVSDLLFRPEFKFYVYNFFLNVSRFLT